MAELLAHSPLGGSGAYRWMLCPGSVGYSEGVEDPESEHAALGTAAHAVGEHCLTHDMDAWQYLGWGIAPDRDAFYVPETKGMSDDPGITIADKKMADAVQVYLTAVRDAHFDRHQGNFWVERRFYCPSLHELMYGQSDTVYWSEKERVLDIWDYKHGAGIVVEVQRNPQLMYYGVGILEDLNLWDAVDKVILHVAQPRGFHFDGPLREWAVSTADLRAWAHDVLIPAMDRAMTSTDTASGEHCRFCPARTRACPQLLADANEIQELLDMMKQKGGAKSLTNEQVGRFLDLSEVLKIAGKAARETGYAREQQGIVIPGWKLGKARSNREWKELAEAAAIKLFGKKKAFTTPEMKSPAKVDEMPGGKAFTSEHAFKPDKGLQLIRASDSRPDAGPKGRAMFKPVNKKGKSKK